MRRVLVALVAVAGAGLAVCPAAGAQSADRWVTIAARECDTYTDIRANLARNNIMESLKDLGADTLYTSGEPIDPRTELEGQPNCRPIVGWRFATGTGLPEPRGQRSVGGAVDRQRRRPGRVRDQGGRARARLRRASGQRRREDRRRGHRRAEPRPGRPRRPEPPVAPGRHAHGSGALRRPGVRRPLRVRRAALRDRRPQRRQRRDDPVPVRHAAHVLLRVLRHAAAVVGQDRHPQGGRRVAGERDASASAATCPTTRAARSTFRRRGRPGVDGVRPRRDAARRRALDGDRGRARGLDADRPRVHVAVEHGHRRRRGAHRADQPGRGRHGHLHVHQPAHAAGGRAACCARSPEGGTGDVPVPHPRRGRRRRRAPQPDDPLGEAASGPSA